MLSTSALGLSRRRWFGRGDVEASSLFLELSSFGLRSLGDEAPVLLTTSPLSLGRPARRFGLGDEAPEMIRLR